MLFGVKGLQVTDAQALPDGTVEVWAVTDHPARGSVPGLRDGPGPLATLS